MKTQHLVAALLMLISAYSQSVPKTQPKESTVSEQQGRAGSHPQLKRFTPKQLQQLVDCMLRLRIDKKYYGPNLRFRYVILPPWEEGRSEELRLVVYDPGKKTGVFLAYGFKRGKCMKFHLANESPLNVDRHGKPDLDEEHMGNGGIGTYDGFMKDLHKLLPTPMVEMDIRSLHRTCARCLGPNDPDDPDE